MQCSSGQQKKCEVHIVADDILLLSARCSKILIKYQNLFDFLILKILILNQFNYLFHFLKL